MQKVKQFLVSVDDRNTKDQIREHLQAFCYGDVKVTEYKPEMSAREFLTKMKNLPTKFDDTLDTKSIECIKYWVDVLGIEQLIARAEGV